MYSTSVITKGILFQDLLNPKSYGRAYMAYSVIIMSPLSSADPMTKIGYSFNRYVFRPDRLLFLYDGKYNF